jgi:IclR family acetate operon transcriptional repressor
VKKAENKKPETKRVHMQKTGAVDAPKRAGNAPVSGKDVSLSIVKAATILKLVGDASNGLTLTEVVAATGYSTTVCHRMLATLEHERLVDRDKQSGRYWLGFGLISLAHKALRMHPVGTRTEHLLVEAARKMDDVALLMVLDGMEALCINRKEGNSQILSLGTQIGSRLALHCGGGPFALLAFSSDEFIDRYLSQKLEKCTSKTVTDPRKIRARIQEARECGYTVGNEDLFDHIVAVGVPIFDQSGLLLGSVTVSGVAPRYNAKRIKQTADWLRNAAKQVPLA